MQLTLVVACFHGVHIRHHHRPLRYASPLLEKWVRVQLSGGGLLYPDPPPDNCKNRIGFASRSAPIQIKRTSYLSGKKRAHSCLSGFDLTLMRLNNMRRWRTWRVKHSIGNDFQSTAVRCQFDLRSVQFNQSLSVLAPKNVNLMLNLRCLAKQFIALQLSFTKGNSA